MNCYKTLRVDRDLLLVPREGVVQWLQNCGHAGVGQLAHNLGRDGVGGEEEDREGRKEVDEVGVVRMRLAVRRRGLGTRPRLE